MKISGIIMKLKSFVFSPFSVNSYVIFDEVTLETAIIDPGCNSEEEENELSEYINSQNLKIKYLINTHCHLDHIFGNNFVKKSFNPEYLIPKKDLFLIENAQKMANAFDVEMEEVMPPDGFYDENSLFQIGNFTLTPLFTPGHTPGEYCLYCKEENICFTGDVLFAGAIGRTDLWGGDFDILIHSIKTKLLTLPNEIIVYPGHETSTTIGQEKVQNGYLRGI
jgi:glyoxylase-like metal-dependent hydrolase (beta-lactamase superfamily II)